MQLTSATEMRSAYAGSDVASHYVARRFASELSRLLHDRQVAAINGLFERLRPRRTLEIAAGPARLTRDLRPTGTLVCVDYNEGMIAEGRTVSSTSARWLRADAFRLPFRPAFDFVYSFRFVRHFRAPDRRQLYAEVCRLLVPGGTFVLDAVNERVSAPLRRANPAEYPIYDECYELESLRAELRAAGLEPVRIEPVQKFYALQYRSQVVLGPRSNWLNRILVRGLERLPCRDGLEWIVTCRRS